MTFDEYNTDENFDKKESSLDELVKLGLEEGKSSDEIKSSLSPKWQKSKKIGEFDNYVTKYSKPKEEQKEEVKETVKTTAPETKTNITASDKNFTDSQFGLADYANDKVRQSNAAKSQENWDELAGTMEKQGQAFRRIDDKLVAQLPTFLLKRYANGEFGDVSDDTTPEGKESKKNAQLRLAHFLLNGVGSKLKMASNIAMRTAGKAPMFEDTTSDYEKYQQSNFAKGMENRWRKYEAETNAAIDLATKEGGNEQELRNTAQQITQTNKLNSAFNMLNENQKVYALRVVNKIGNEIGNLSDDQFINMLIGFAVSGDNLTWQEAAEILVGKFGKDALGGKLGGKIGGGKPVVAGVGGSGEDKPIAELEDGTVIDPGNWMSSKEYKELVAAADNLSNQYYNGEIDADKFRSEYAKLEEVMKSHGIANSIHGIKPIDKMIKANNEMKLAEIDEKLTTLNKGVKKMDKEEYLKQFNALRAEAVKYGANDKQLAYIDKKKKR